MLHNSHRDFIRRHIGTSAKDQSKMLTELGYKNLDSLIDDTVPDKIRFKDKLSIGDRNGLLRNLYSKCYSKKYT